MARVLVTGSSGAIGRPACSELRARGHFVRAFDLAPTPEVDEALTGDVADREAVLRAAAGMEAVVHLAAVPVDAPLATLVGPNILGVHHVLEAAREHAVRRVVLASTIQTVGHLSRERRVTAADRAPGNHYALTKTLAEDMAAMVSRRDALSIVVARIAWMVRNPTEAKRMVELGAYDLYVSPRDTA
ncbi:MAG TPA: NAD(P)-dependent oxidoreductase, partial [Polyangiaceae bacterium]